MAKILSQAQLNCLQQTTQVQEWLKPLRRKTVISQVSFSRVYADGRYLFLSSHERWLQGYFEREFNTALTLQQCPELLKTKYHLWSEMANSSAVAYTLKNFDVRNGMSVVDKQDDHIDLYHYCTEKVVQDSGEWYINYREIIDHFSNYLLSKVEQLSQKPLVIKQPTQRAEIVETLLDEYEQNQEGICQLKQELYESTTIETITLHIDNRAVTLCKREIQCIELLRQGLTAKEMAKRLYLSPRTIEYYLASLREKCRCHSKTELLAILEMYY